MKQIEKTAQIIAALTSKGLNPDKVAVFEATAVNTRPLRKKHPLYKDGVMKRGLLSEMQMALEQETVPVQIMHDSSILPVGRVFQGKVVDTPVDSEIRVLMAISHEHEAEIEKIEAGVIDQVSVSVMPKHIWNSKSNFDYLGADSTPENLWSGSDNDGNVIGEKGVYGILDGLSEWNELSLVHKGGAQNARIINRSNSVFAPEIQRLAAQGVDPNFLTLNANIQETKPMANADLQATIDQISDLKVDLSNVKRERKEFEDQVATLRQEIETLSAQLAKAEKKEGPSAEELKAAHEAEEARKQEVETLKADNTALQAELTEIAKTVLVAKGDVDPKVPTDVSGLVAVIGEARKDLPKVLSAGAKSLNA